eukprot:96078-Amphidinium_carterae.1
MHLSLEANSIQEGSAFRSAGLRACWHCRHGLNFLMPSACLPSCLPRKGYSSSAKVASAAHLLTFTHGGVDRFVLTLLTLCRYTIKHAVLDRKSTPLQAGRPWHHNRPTRRHLYYLSSKVMYCNTRQHEGSKF